MTDTYTDHNPDNPINQPDFEDETLEDDNLEYKLKNQIRATLYHKENCEKEEAFNMELCEKIALAKIELKKCIELAEQCNNTLLYNQLLKIKL